MKVRVLRYSAMLEKALYSICLKYFDGKVYVTRVNVSQDLLNVNIYVSFFDDYRDVNIPFIQHVICSNIAEYMRIRKVPRCKVYKDEGLRECNEVYAELDEVNYTRE